MPSGRCRRRVCLLRGLNLLLHHADRAHGNFSRDEPRLYLRELCGRQWQ